MVHNFRPVNRDQLYLLPPSLRDWLPGDHFAWFLIGRGRSDGPEQVPAQVPLRQVGR